MDVSVNRSDVLFFIVNFEIVTIFSEKTFVMLFVFIITQYFDPSLSPVSTRSHGIKDAIRHLKQNRNTEKQNKRVIQLCLQKNEIVL